jgi:hypothetical protein
MAERTTPTARCHHRLQVVVFGEALPAAGVQ